MTDMEQLERRIRCRVATIHHSAWKLIEALKKAGWSAPTSEAKHE